MAKIIRGYWSCNACNSKDLDGLIDECPNCGRRKPQDIRYYIKQGSTDELTEEELNNAGISVEECDGKHTEWVCNYCNQLNNWKDTSCTACGGEKADATHEYGMRNIKTEHPDNSPEIPDTTETTTFSKIETPSFQIKRKENLFLAVLGISIITFFLFLFWPIKEQVTVTGHSWERNISIEEERTVKEDGWSVPSGGRIYDEQREIRSYKNVVDHYETVVEQKSRRVIDHYDTSYSYKDNGNGTFTPVKEKTPVYKTEYYTETKQKPVYRQEPVYDTKYYYEIEKWFIVDNYLSSGNGKEPYWNENYILGEKERDIMRSEYYYIHYDNEKSQQVNYEKWSAIKEGDYYLLTKNRLGITYSAELISK